MMRARRELKTVMVGKLWRERGDGLRRGGGGWRGRRRRWHLCRAFSVVNGGRFVCALESMGAL